MSVNFITGDVVERGPAVFLRQITGANGVLVKIADIVSITVDVYIVPMTRGRYRELFGVLPVGDSSVLPVNASGTPVAINIGESFVVAASIFDTPQLDNRWTQDTIGYNFAVTLAAENFPQIDLADYPTPEWQEVWFNFVPTVGDPFSTPFVVKKSFSLANRSSGTGSL